MIRTDVIFSINVHEKKDFLIKQLKNINEYVDLNYIIIINANDFMYNEISKCNYIKSLKNVVLYPEYLNKKHFHGSLTKGIYLNMKYAIKNYNFKYFVILSSRNVFYNKFNKQIWNSLPKTGPDTRDGSIHNLEKDLWWWPSFLQTKLSKYIINNNLLFSSSPHEGLTFDNDSCVKIEHFLNNNKDIREDLFNWNHCVEEFALQTICINLSGKYYNIGNGVSTNYNVNNLPKNKYVYKIERFQSKKENNFVLLKKHYILVLFLVFLFVLFKLYTIYKNN